MATGDPVDVELEPRFNEKQLGRAARWLVILAILLIVVGWKVGADLGLFSASARGVDNTRVLANTVAVWLALTGVVVLFVGAFGALADLRKPKASVPNPPPPAGPVEAQALGVAAGAIGTVVESLGKAFATLKGSSALIVAGIILMVTSGLLAWQSVPEAACESNLTTTQRSGTSEDDITSYSESTSEGIGPCPATPSTTTPPTTATTQPSTTDPTDPTEPSSGDSGSGTDGAGSTGGTSTGDG